ncbi:MAG: T9SS type A sorting domain-containing protein [Ferruginibacter sp.]
MKKPIALLCLILFKGILPYAQIPELTVQTTSPVVGDAVTYQYCSVEGVTNGTTGEQQVWDFSDLKDSTASIEYEYVNPRQTPYANTFAAANIARVSKPGYDSAYEYYQSGSSSIYEVGNVFSTNPETFPHFKVILKYPFTYNSFFSDTVSQLSPGYQSPIVGRDTLFADGYGTLQLPTQTFTNVLRVKYIDDGSTNQPWSGIPATMHRRTVQYLYFVPGFHGPVLNITEQQIQYTYYFGVMLPLNRFRRISYAKDAVLPIQVTSFKGVIEKNNIRLYWTTTTELNTDYFNMQRGVDGLHFLNIGKVYASNLVNGSSYVFNDANAVANHSVLYYRIQEIDKDGKYYYSEIRQIKMNRALWVIKTYPNPVQKTLQVVSQGEPLIEMLDLYNAVGILVKRFHDINSGKTFDLSALAHGLYLLQGYNKGRKISMTFIKE